MHVLVGGGTGAIGRGLIRVLEARGDSVSVVTRAAVSPAEKGAVRTIAWDSPDLRAAVESSDAVVNLAGAPVADERWTPERLSLIRSSRVDTTQALARAIAGAPAGSRPKVFVSGSAVGIYGMRDDDAPCGEEAPHGDDELARIVEAWEEAAAPAESAGVRVAYARTGLVLDPQAGVLRKMLGPFRFFVGGPLGDGKQAMSWIHRGDEVRALLFAIDEPRLSGPFNAVAPNAVSMNALARALGEVLRRPSFFRVPRVALRIAVGEGVARVVLTGQRAVPKKLEALGFRFDFPELAPALEDLLK